MPLPKHHVVRHRDGSVWAKGKMLGQLQDGFWIWYRKDGTKLRSGSFAKGKQVGRWTTYDRQGKVYKVTDMALSTTQRRKRKKPRGTDPLSC